MIDAWVLSSIEVAEICSKALDWKVKQSSLGESVSQQYLLFLEEISLSLDLVFENQDFSKE